MISNDSLLIVDNLLLALKEKDYDKTILPETINSTIAEINKLKSEKEKINPVVYLAKAYYLYAIINSFLSEEIDNQLNIIL